MKMVDVDKVPAADAAKKWVDENEIKWRPWVDAATHVDIVALSAE